MMWTEEVDHKPSIDRIKIQLITNWDQISPDPAGRKTVQTDCH